MPLCLFTSYFICNMIANSIGMYAWHEWSVLGSCLRWYEAEIWGYFFVILNCSFKYIVFWVTGVEFRNTLLGHKEVVTTIDI